MSTALCAWIQHSAGWREASRAAQSDAGVRRRAGAGLAARWVFWQDARFPGETRMARRAWLVWSQRILLLLAALLALAVLGAWLFLRASLPQLDGKRASPLLSGTVTVTRDANGVPTI